MNKGRKPSRHISVHQSRAICDAALYAFCTARSLNRFITIHFGKAGVRSQALECLGDFLKHAGDWLSSRGYGPPCYVYVFENPEKGGLHVHILLHVPHGDWADFAKAERRWLRNAVERVGGKFRAGTLSDKEVRNSANFAAGTASLIQYLNGGLRGCLLYLLKGADAGVPALLGLDDEAIRNLSKKLQLSTQGIVVGKRVGFSEALSRRRHSFPSLEIRPGVFMPGPEARARSILRELAGLEFSASKLRHQPSTRRLGAQSAAKPSRTAARGGLARRGSNERRRG